MEGWAPSARWRCIFFWKSAVPSGEDSWLRSERSGLVAAAAWLLAASPCPRCWKATFRCSSSVENGLLRWLGSWPMLSAALSERFGFLVTVNVYTTPAGSQGFGNTARRAAS